MGLMVAAWMLGLVPLVFVAALNAPRAYWWLALVFAVSWMADAATLLTTAPWWVSRVYPVSQAALVSAVFLSRAEAKAALVFLVVVGFVACLLQPAGPEIALHVAAWLFAAAIASDEAPQPLRRALVTYFGLGTLLWVPYAIHPTWPSGWWLAYQGSRLLGILLFGYACLRPAPRLRVT